VIIMTNHPKFSDFATDDKNIASHTEHLGIHNPLEEVLRKTPW